MNVEWLERGPLVARAKIYYRYDRAELRGAYEPEVIPAGEVKTPVGSVMPEQRSYHWRDNAQQKLP